MSGLGGGLGVPGFDVAIDNIVLNDGLVEIIPEPTTCALFALGALACGHTARRRRKRMQKRS